MYPSPLLPLLLTLPVLILAYPDARPAARPVATFSPSLDTRTLHPRALYRYFRADDPDCQMCACDDNGQVRCPVPKDQTHTVPDKCYFVRNNSKKYCTKIEDPTDEMETKDTTKGTADQSKPKKGTVAGGGVIGGRVGKSTKTRPQPPKAQKAVGDVDGNAKVMDWLGGQ